MNKIHHIIGLCIIFCNTYSSSSYLPLFINFKDVIQVVPSTHNALRLNQLLASKANQLNMLWVNLPNIKTRKEVKASLNDTFKQMHNDARSISSKDDNELYALETETRIIFYDIHEVLRSQTELRFLSTIISTPK